MEKTDEKVHTLDCLLEENRKLKEEVKKLTCEIKDLKYCNSTLVKTYEEKITMLNEQNQILQANYEAKLQI